ncbi:MAG TPA: extracellular solute-binding protein [Acidimicrobiales bacterium]|nr:extracellular solute-binding protein [Acidimicrobiales bacterium]
MFSKSARRRSCAALMAAAGVTSGLVATAATASAGGKVTLVFTSQYNGNNDLDNWITAAAKVFEKTHPNVTVALRNIVTDSESTYYAKLDLAERSASTTPDISYEDSFLVQSDAAAGYIRPLPQLTSDPEWKAQYPVFHSMTDYNGVPYGMMIETDVQQLYYDMPLFKKAGLPTTWQPKTWADIITAAKAIKAHDPGVTPLWIYTGTPLGEASSFRGFEVLLGGTSDWLYDTTTKKWETGGPGFNAVFNFLETLQKDGLTESTSYWSNPNAGTVVSTQLMPAQQVAISMDGSWVSTTWLPSGTKPWSQAYSTYNVADWPTENGQGAGVTNESGGWTLAVPAKSKNAALAVQFIETATTPALLANFDGVSGQLPVEANVANDPTFKDLVKDDPLFVKATTYVSHTTYRPGFGPYTQISADIAAITGQISLGQLTATQAEQQYAKDVTQAAGPGNTQKMSS